MVQTIYRLSIGQIVLLNSIAKRICLEFNRVRHADELDKETLHTLCNSSLAAELHGRLNHQLGVVQGLYTMDMETECINEDIKYEAGNIDPRGNESKTDVVLTILEYRMLGEAVPQLYGLGSPEIQLLQYLKEGYELRMFG